MKQIYKQQYSLFRIGLSVLALTLIILPEQQNLTKSYSMLVRQVLPFLNITEIKYKLFVFEAKESKLKHVTVNVY